MIDICQRLKQQCFTFGLSCNSKPQKLLKICSQQISMERKGDLSFGFRSSTN